MNKMMMILAGLALSFNAVAAEATKEVKKDVKNAKVVVLPSQTLKLDTAASKAAWTGKKIAGPHHGSVQFKDGSFVVKKGGAMTGDVTVDLTTIADEDLTDAEYNKKLVTHLKSEDFFNVAKYPTATFKIKSFTEVNNFVPGQPNAVAKGDLTIRGITKPSEIKLFFTPNDNGFEAKGKLIVDRTKFGLQYNSKKFFDVKSLGDKLIDDNFEVDLTLVAKK
jgi:polyisoprenoid-binding protein YceI